MAYKNIDEYTTSQGTLPLLLALKDAVPYCYEAICLTFMIIIMGASSFASKTESTRAKFINSYAVASFVTLPLVIFFAMAGLLVNVNSIMFFTALSILGFILLIFFK